MGGTDKAKEWVEKYHDKAEAAGVAVAPPLPIMLRPLMIDRPCYSLFMPAACCPALMTSWPWSPLAP
jgi:hypothetical protein